MSSAISFHLPPVYPLPPETLTVRETGPKRKLEADLVRIGKFFEPNMPDPISNILQQWHANFTKGLREKRTVQHAGESDDARFDRILDKHLEQLQKLLRDPLTNTPLDREAVLGSDGETYGYKSLCLAVSRLPAAYAHSSPLHPNPAVPFTQKPHLLVRHMVRFLAEWNALEPSHALEQEFDTYFQTHPLPVLAMTPVGVPANPVPAQPAQALPRQNQHPALGPRPRIMGFSRLWAEDAAAAGVAARPPAQRGNSNVMTMNDLWAQDDQAANLIPIALVVPFQAPPAQPGFSAANLDVLLGIIDEQDQADAQQAQEQAQADATFAHNLNDVVDAVIDGIQQEFAPVQAQQAAFAEAIDQAIQVYQAQNAADIAALQNEINNIQQEIAAVTAAIQQLPPHIHTLKHEILEAKKEDLELQLEIKQLDLAVVEYKNSKMDSLGALIAGGIGLGLTFLCASLAPYWLPNSITAVFPTGSGTGLQFATKIMI